MCFLWFILSGLRSADPSQEEKGKDKWKRVQELKAAAKAAAAASGIDVSGVVGRISSEGGVGGGVEGGVKNQGLSNTTTAESRPLPTPAEPITAQAAQDRELLRSKDGYANVHQLKDIFHREGGVWFGDEILTLEGAVGKGGACTDPLFLAAEKRGIDIRLKSNFTGGGFSLSKLFDLGASQGVSGGEGAESASKSGSFGFGFFAGADTAALSPFAPSSKTDGTDGTGGADSGVSGVSGGSGAGMGMDAAPRAHSHTNNSSEGEERVRVQCSAAELVALARLFSREK
ncbi:hypothetical protein B484DRAFT_210480 [Ochromonadaceae sp. CCMP2298]|nr:hypothetical protein B484DRAFT_210480 [Ochromonadaceae sp. CCMP2298]